MPPGTTARQHSDRGVVSDLAHEYRVAPPLVVSRDEIDRMVTVADKALMIAEGQFAA